MRKVDVLIGHHPVGGSSTGPRLVPGLDTEAGTEEPSQVKLVGSHVVLQRSRGVGSEFEQVIAEMRTCVFGSHQSASLQGRDESVGDLADVATVVRLTPDQETVAADL